MTVYRAAFQPAQQSEFPLSKEDDAKWTLASSRGHVRRAPFSIAANRAGFPEKSELSMSHREKRERESQPWVDQED